ncbi:efflux RND transporter periplasmic adaptor subunit [Singulisphaera sp. PoT]|uniref:efflux RND transporter periplasmic adaptor subunit n=1 Tax=Singulisphaera sp. PoT TaxID=3411797 RepID=UPI003BF61582
MRALLSALVFVIPLSMDRGILADTKAEAPGGPARQAEQRVPEIVLPKCAIDYDRVTTLGAHLTVGTAGTLKDLLVRRGDRVKAGQVIGHLYDDELRIEYKRLKAIAESNVAVKLAESKVTMCDSKLRHSKSLRVRNLLSDEDMELHQFNLTEARLSLEAAKQEQLLAEHARDRVGADISARELVSPHNGVIVDILKNPGESLPPNEPVVQLVDVDMLRVTGFVDASDSWRVRVGERVQITPDLNGSAPEVEQQIFSGKIVFVDRRIDQTTQTCRIMAEVPNRDTLLRSGLECRMVIFLDKTDSISRPQTSGNDALKSIENTNDAAPLVAPDASSSGTAPTSRTPH